jgi:hypothetical protein
MAPCRKDFNEYGHLTCADVKASIGNLVGRLVLVLLGLLAGLASIAAIEGLLRVTDAGSRIGAGDVGRPAWMDDEVYALFQARIPELEAESDSFGHLEAWQWHP